MAARAFTALDELAQLAAGKGGGVSDDLWVALIGAFGLVLAAFATQNRQIRHIQRDTRQSRVDGEAVRWQVQNTHKTNLREDHDRLAEDVRQVLELQRDMARRVDSLAAANRASDRRQQEDIAGLSRRLDDHIDGST